MNILAVLSQTEHWVTADGMTMPLRKMPRQQKAAILTLLEERARPITDGIIDDVVFGFLGDEPLGSHEGMTVAEIVEEIEAVDPTAWVNAQPLVRKLRADVDILEGLRKRKPVPVAA